jgi:uncharacterized membrane protein YheB (UPF0754 family)
MTDMHMIPCTQAETISKIEIEQNEQSRAMGLFAYEQRKQSADILEIKMIQAKIWDVVNEKNISNGKHDVRIDQVEKRVEGLAGRAWAVIAMALGGLIGGLIGMFKN